MLASMMITIMKSEEDGCHYASRFRQNVMSWMLSIGTFGVGTFGGGRGKGFGLITDTPTFGRQGSAGTSYLRWATWQKLECERNLLLSSAQIKNIPINIMRSVNWKTSNSGMLNLKLVWQG